MIKKVKFKVVLVDFELFTLLKMNFTTNRGNEIEAKNTQAAIDEMAKNLVLLESERVGCPLKIETKEIFKSPRLAGVGVRLIAIPDLPDFVSRLIADMPRIDASFLIHESPAPGDEWEVASNVPGTLPFHYQAETWEEATTKHCYFQALTGAVRDGFNPDSVFVDLKHAEGRTHGLILRNATVSGSVSASLANPLPQPTTTN